ncbi:MAG: S8 family serine peptidase, partial [Kiritimatiellae bacterium]|nr:S8 family serine peptidase [Kiritimatiellia bacterium]
MSNFKKIKTVLFLFVFMGALIFAGGLNRKIQFPSDLSFTPLKPYAEGEVIVKFKKGVTLSAVNQVAVQSMMAVKKHFATLSKLRGQEYAVLKSSNANSLDMVNVLKRNASVEAVSLNYRNELAATPNDPRYSELWGMNNTGQTGGTADADIDAPEAWNINTGSAGNIVAVIDSGLDYTHPDLAANVWVNAAEQAGSAGVDDDGNGYVDDIYGIDAAYSDTDPMDVDGHGTHCAGTIGAVGNNNLGVVGVNWNVKILGLKFLDDTGSGWDSDAIECIEYAIDKKVNYAQNIVAINASWGGGGFNQILKDAIDAAGTAGIVFCAAAGNAGTNNDTTPHYPSSYNSPSIIAVASTDHNDVIASSSCYGATSVDLGAPGVGILSTIPPSYVAQAGDIFFDDMESGVGNWTHGGTLDTWALTTTQDPIFVNPSFPVPSPPTFWSDSPGVNYVEDTDSWLAYNADIDLSGYVGQDVYLGIGSAMYFEYGWDSGIVEFSNNSGATWTPIYDFTYDAYYWSSWSWKIDDAFKTAHFRMRFHLISDYIYNEPGWMIDNVGIGLANTYYEAWNGTSMATPHVAGAVALMASQFPSESVAARIYRILSTVDANTSLVGKSVTAGRLNLFNAISYAVPAITVTSPNGGESWMVSSSHDITWSSTGTIANVNIDYSINSGGSWTPVVVGTANDGSYAWTVPSTPSTTCLVRVSDTANAATLDTSDAVLTITTSTVETVSSPNTLTGPATGMISTSYDYSTGGATSSLGHSVQYLFDWDDGTTSGWLAEGTTTASHSWAAAGTYDVRAMARCVDHTTVESIWSATLSVIIYDGGGTTGSYNSPAQYKVLPEVIWSSATGGGTWMSNVQVTDVSGGS